MTCKSILEPSIALASEDALTLGEQLAALQDEHQDSHFPIDVKLGPGESG